DVQGAPADAARDRTSGGGGMTDHRRFIDLAATSIDFDLTPAERAELDAHLAACADCGETARGYRADALALVALPALQLAPDRSSVILERIAGRRRSAAPPIGRLLVAALLALLAASVALTVGAELLRRAREQRQLTVVPERPVAQASLEASPLPSTSTAPAEVYAGGPAGILRKDHYTPTSIAVGPDGQVVVVGGAELGRCRWPGRGRRRGRVRDELGYGHIVRGADVTRGFDRSCRTRSRRYRYRLGRRRSGPDQRTAARHRSCRSVGRRVRRDRLRGRWRLRRLERAPGAREALGASATRSCIQGCAGQDGRGDRRGLGHRWRDLRA